MAVSLRHVGFAIFISGSFLDHDSEAWARRSAIRLVPDLLRLEQIAHGGGEMLAAEPGLAGFIFIANSAGAYQGPVCRPLSGSRA